MSRPIALVLVLLLAAALPPAAHGYQFNLEVGITDSRAIHLRVGDRAPQDLGTNYTDGYNWFFCLLAPINCAGGSPTPGRNGARTVVTANVPANLVGTGTPIAMSSNSAGAHLQSSYDGTTRCLPGQVYIGGFSRKPGTSNAARLSVQAEPQLRNGSQSIPISEISWTTTGGHIASGTLSPAPQQIGTIPPNTWVEACMSFTYANTQVRPAGTYTARATYTLSLP